MNEPFQCVSTTNRNFPGRMGHKVRAGFRNTGTPQVIFFLGVRTLDVKAFMVQPLGMRF